MKQRVYLLSTGGTIEKVYSEQTGSVVNVTSKIERYLRLLRLPETEVVVRHVMNKDSLEMTEEDREQVYLAVLRTLANPAPVVISHGTGDYASTETQARVCAAIKHGAIYPRSRSEFGRVFEGLELVAPGIVSVPDWQPEDGPEPRLP